MQLAVPVHHLPVLAVRQLAVLTAALLQQLESVAARSLAMVAAPIHPLVLVLVLMEPADVVDALHHAGERRH